MTLRVLLQLHGLKAGKYSYIFFKGCHQPQVEGGEIGFKELWLIRCRGDTLGPLFN